MSSRGHRSHPSAKGNKEKLLANMMSSLEMVVCVLLLFLINAVDLSMALGDVKTIDWVLEETTYTRMCSTKKILTVNGMFPGPALYLHRGQTIKINVHNRGIIGFTLHFHGVKQPRNSWSDGPEFVTQCPIKPGSNFTYEVILSDEEGTLWYHAHSDWTRATVHGPIIVYPGFGRLYPFIKPHKEIPIVLGSWYKGDPNKVIAAALATGGDYNLSDAFTINGQPGDTQPCSTKDMYRLPVIFGKIYLLRIVNAVLNEEMLFAVANHKLTVVAIDASYIKPITHDFIMITPGQTMDVLIIANQNPTRNYYITSRAFGGLLISKATTTGIFQYISNGGGNASAPTLPDFNDDAAAHAFTNQFRSLNTWLHPISVPQQIDRRVIITIAIGTLPCEQGKTCLGPFGDKLTASLSNITFQHPKIDVLQAYYKKIGGVYKTDFPNEPEHPFNYTMNPISFDFNMQDLNGTRVLEIDYGTDLEIVFQGTNVMFAAENHPMHLHGYSFYQVGWGLGNFDEKVHPKGYNLNDPPFMNTLSVPKNGWVAIRFKTDNPGVWFMHCHLEAHSSFGMDTVLIVKNGPTKETSLRPPSYIIPC